MYKRTCWLCIFGGLLFGLILALVFSSSAVAVDKSAKKSDKEEKPVEEVVPPVEDDRVCEAEIFYTWKRLPPPPPPPSSGQPGKELVVTAVSKGKDLPKDTDKSEEAIEEFFGNVSEKGSDDERLKESLMRRLSEERGKAKVHCEKVRESESSCTAEKLKPLSVDYRELDFVARRKLLDSISSDCSRNLGVCLSTRSGPVNCYSAALPKPKAAEQPEEVTDKGKGKDKK
ncbi:MAG: hypothetical protein IT291_01570 [Deltaproteobacteria bacterium]|nr:hypothetical protein [Deltaproteobacteria bacterium]